ncbi:MAG: anhydro-N-acetylmuramic acid kinase [Balneolaceae bacterium]
MNPSVKKLGLSANKKIRTIIGLMSGTSLDGLDIALCKIRGSGANTSVELRKFITKEYDEGQKSRLKMISSVENVELKELCYQHTWLASVHTGMINEALAEWNIKPEEVDCIASHGQTIYHLPERDQPEESEPLNSTLQIADGDQIAVKTGIVTISDFRQKHIAHGGEGAPMAALVDRLLFGHETESRILLNIGGIANFTWLPAGKQSNEKSFTTDTGPGNTLIDNVVQNYFNQPYDRDGKIASSGNVHAALLNLLSRDSWFDEKNSKSTGPEYFNLDWIERLAKNAGIKLKNINPEDLVATVTELSAKTIAQSIKANVSKPEDCQIYTSGGGAHNPVLIKRLKEILVQTNLHDFSKLGFDPDAKEAIIFAVLANEMLAGDGFEFESNGEKKRVNFGKISFPF